jgi:cysteine synthase B
MIETQDAYEMTRQIIKQEGIFVWMSSGAAMCAAIEISKTIRSWVVVVIFPDRAEKYLSTDLFK